MKKGKILSFNPLRHWGFLRDVATKEEYFFHEDDLLGTVPIPSDLVTFDVGVNARGQRKAIDVQVVKP